MIADPNTPVERRYDELRELVEYAGVRGEEEAQIWKEERKAAGLHGRDACGGAIVLMRFEDRRLLNAMKAAKLVTKGVYPGEWVLEQRWARVGQEAGIAIAMAEGVARVLKEALAGRVSAYVDGWWS